MRKFLLLFILFFFVFLFDIGMMFFYQGGGDFALVFLTLYVLIAVVVCVLIVLQKWLGYTVVDYGMLFITCIPLGMMFFRIGNLLFFVR